MGLRRWQRRRWQNDMQFDSLHSPRQRSLLRPHHLHRPRSQSQRRISAAFHQNPHSRQWLLQPLRHGD